MQLATKVDEQVQAQASSTKSWRPGAADMQKPDQKPPAGVRNIAPPYKQNPLEMV